MHLTESLTTKTKTSAILQKLHLNAATVHVCYASNSTVHCVSKKLSPFIIDKTLWTVNQQSYFLADVHKKIF